MKFDITDTLFALSFGLDCVEHDLIGVTTHHGKRVACLSWHMGHFLGLSPAELADLCAAAILHDNALTQFIHTELSAGQTLSNMKQQFDISAHCVEGEENVSHLPIYPQIKGAVLYHHEHADGSGPLGFAWKDIPLYARIIHLADTIDAAFDCSHITPQKQTAIISFIQQNTNHLFDIDCSNAFLSSVKDLQYQEMANEKIDIFLKELIPSNMIDTSSSQLKDFASLFAKIIDYKSEFTCNHSLGIAEKAREMGAYYGYDEEKQTKLYFAGCLHDIGKLVIDRDVLEKPDKLTDTEYIHIQTHAYYTFYMLNSIRGLRDITSWASNHHEKLDGTGYPFGKKAPELSKDDRLMGCIDIYQALSEDRPYKPGMTHQKSMDILYDMADKGKIDSDICHDIDLVFGNKL